MKAGSPSPGLPRRKRMPARATCHRAATSRPSSLRANSLDVRVVRSLPLAGEGWGEGWRQRRRAWLTPLPNPPPQGGREHTFRAVKAYAQRCEQIWLAISRRIAPECCLTTSRPLCQRAQGRPGARCTRGLACKCTQQKRTRAYRFSGNTPAFPAQWLYGLLRALPGERLSCHRHRRDASRQLGASTAASGPHDFTVRVRRVRLAHHQRPSHLTARS
jgi:hypothetical protein